MSDDPLPVTHQLCERCGGEGKLYTSRYGGNDPDVWPIGECPVCEGSGYALYETEPLEEEDIMDEEMMAALEKDGEMLRQMTGADHGPYFLPDVAEDGAAESKLASTERPEATSNSPLPDAPKQD